MKNHFIVSIYDNKNRILEFERFGLKTAQGSYNSFIKFIRKYGLEKYESGFNTIGLEYIKGIPHKLIVSYQSYEPNVESIIFEKSYDEFISDLKSI